MTNYLSMDEIRERAQNLVEQDYTPNELSFATELGISSYDSLVDKYQQKIMKFYHEKFQSEVLPQRLLAEYEVFAQERLTNSEYSLLELDPSMTMPKEHKEFMDWYFSDVV